MTDVTPQEFLSILEDPDAHYLREGVKEFKQILFDHLFDYMAEYVDVGFGRSKRNVLLITVKTDDQDALDEMDKYFTLCFSQVMHRAFIKKRQYSDTFERQYILQKTKDRGQARVS